MFLTLIDNTKQVCKDILLVCQLYIDIKRKLLFGIIKSYTLSFFPQVVRLWDSLPKDITNIQDKTNFTEKVESFLE